MIHKIQHTYSEEIFLPWAAIDNNVGFILHPEDNKIETTDGVICNIIESKAVHVFSIKGLNLITRLYNIQVATFLQRWYDKTGFCSLEFLYLKLNKDDGDTTT